jgi:uncharacterized protein (TIGR02996 family)
MDPYSEPDWHNFVKWIRSEPNDDAPRLIAADWLLDNGDEVRAEFIRLQIEIHRLNDTDKESKRVKRAKWLLSRNRKRWWVYAPYEVKWTRGFVGGFHIRNRSWSHTHRELLATHPITELTFDYFPTLYLILESNRRLIPTFEPQSLAFRWPCDDLVRELFAREHPGIAIHGPAVENFFSERGRVSKNGERFVFSPTRGHITNLRVERSEEEEGVFILPTLPPPVPKRT